MSVNFSAIAVIGLKVIEPHKLRIESVERGCDCDISQYHNIVFCPKCGKRAWIDTTKWIYDEDNMILDDVDIVYSTDRKELFLCGAWVTSYSDTTAHKSTYDISDTYALKNKVKLVADKYGVWSENQWGLWAVPYTSY